MSEKTTETFTLGNLDFYDKGYLKGYIYGMVTFSNQPNMAHEILFRMSDDDNGKENTIVSLDWSSRNPEVIESLWNDIEAELTKLGNEWRLKNEHM